MSLSRGEFIKAFGVAMATLIAAHTLPACTIRRSQISAHPAWEKLRQCWLALDSRSTHQPDDPVITEHQAALDELIEAGGIRSDVGDELQMAFVAAWVWQPRDSFTLCYLIGPLPKQLVQDSILGDLLRQQDILTEMGAEISPQVLQSAREAIARDLALLEALQSGDDFDSQLYELYQSGEYIATPQAIEAARILVELLAGESE